MAKDWKMNKREWSMFNHDIKMFNELEQNRYYCRCGHSVTISKSQPRIFCQWCKRWVYKDPDLQKEYDEKMKIEEEKVKRIKFKKELRKRI